MHILFNVIGTVVFVVISMFLPFTKWIQAMSDNVMMQISLVHIIFNVVSTIIMFPFAGALVKRMTECTFSLLTRECSTPLRLP